MGKRRQARQDKRTERRGGTAPTRYQMREKLVAVRDVFFIKDGDGNNVFKVQGKLLRARTTLHFEDMQGNLLCKVQERVLRVKDTMNVEGADGTTIAVAKKAIISPVRDRWIVKIGDGADLKVQGNILDHTYKIGEGGKQVAEVSKKWFRVRDTYGVEIAPGQNDIVILATTVALDMMS